MKLVSLTPQELTFLDPITLKPIATIPGCDTPEWAWIGMTDKPDGEVYLDGAPIAITKTTYGEPNPLPPFQEGVLYIVSTLYRTQSPRSDLVSPGRLVRDEFGNILGCVGLQR